MIKTVTVDHFDGPKKEFVLPEDFGCDSRLANVRQIKILTDLVLQNCGEPEEREVWLAQINNGMTSDDAENYIFAFLTGKWK